MKKIAASILVLLVAFATFAQKPQYNGKVLGVLGGLGPAASADFMRLVTSKAPATVDQEHPRIILLSEPRVPDRNGPIFGHGEDPEPYLRQGLQSLTDWGADILCVTCNTAHYYINHFRDSLSRPLIHIIDETVLASRRRSPEGAWILATLGTLNAGIFQDNAAKSGYSFIVPGEEDLNEVQKVIRLVKAGSLEESGKLLRAICEKLWAEKRLPVVAACTEIPIAYAYTGLPEEMCISSLEALADACIRELYDLKD